MDDVFVLCVYSLPYAKTTDSKETSTSKTCVKNLVMGKSRVEMPAVKVCRVTWNDMVVNRPH